MQSNCAISILPRLSNINVQHTCSYPIIHPTSIHAHDKISPRNFHSPCVCMPEKLSLPSPILSLIVLQLVMVSTWIFIIIVISLGMVVKREPKEAIKHFCHSLFIAKNECKMQGKVVVITFHFIKNHLKSIKSLRYFYEHGFSSKKNSLSEWKAYTFSDP
jgi:hypothetical protein